MARASKPNKTPAKPVPAKRAPAKRATAKRAPAKAQTGVIQVAILKGSGAKTSRAKVAPGTPIRRELPGDWMPSLRAAFVSDVAGGVRPAAELLDVDPAQTSRWASGKSQPSAVQARVLLDMDHVMGHALLVWSSEELVRDWLNTANAHLDGATPAAWIRLHGSAEVVEALRAQAAGAYA